LKRDPHATALGEEVESRHLLDLAPSLTVHDITFKKIYAPPSSIVLTLLTTAVPNGRFRKITSARRHGRHFV
jgi:hypothetical protein